MCGQNENHECTVEFVLKKKKKDKDKKKEKKKRKHIKNIINYFFYFFIFFLQQSQCQMFLKHIKLIRGKTKQR